MKRLILLSAVILVCVSVFAQDTDGPAFKIGTTLSYAGTGGNTDTHSFGWNGLASYAQLRYEVDGGGNFTLATNEGEKTAESMSANGGVKVFVILGRLYGLYRAKWERNTFASLEHRISNLGGLGVVVVNNGMHKWNVETGANYIYEIYPDDIGLAEDANSFIAGHVGTDYTLTPSDTINFSANFAYDIDIEATENQLFGGGGTLSIFVAPWLAVNVGETFAYDNSPVTADLKKLDYTSLVGLTFQNY